MSQQDTIEVEQLWEELNLPIKKSIHSRVKNHEDAEDLLSETFIKVMKESKRNKAPTSMQHLRNWTYRIAKTTSIDWLRRRITKKEKDHLSLSSDYEDEAGQSRFTQYQARPEALADYDADPALEYEYHETSQERSTVILRAWSQLSSMDRTILIEKAKGTSNKELCEKLHLSKSGISMRIARATERFRQKLEKEGINPSQDMPQGLPSLKPS